MEANEDLGGPSEPGPIDPDLVEWAAEVAERIQAGDQVDFEMYAARDPGRAERLRRLLPTIRMMARLGGPDATAPGHDTPEVAGRVGAGAVLGDFLILREIGRGGMGVVYEAVQISLRRPVALKVLPPAAAMDPKNLLRFQLEAQIVASLIHPGIVPVHAVGVDEGVPYYAMQLIPGRSLAELLREQRGQAITEAVAAGLRGDEAPGGEPVPRPELGSGSSSLDRPYFLAIARLGRQAAEALQHAHEQGVVHRDIKPANLLVDPQGKVWVTDFGLARLGGAVDLTATGDLVGTLRYMSPEQARARRGMIDSRTDVYSLGATLYELLTLRPAFDGEDRGVLLRRIAEEEPRPPRRLVREIPRDLETIILKAMAKEPASRYATMRELADDLGRFLEGSPVLARRPTLLDRAVRYAYRQRRSMIAAVVLLLAAIAGLAVANRRIDSEWVEATRQRDAARRATAALMLDRGLALCERGEVGPGLLWLARALEVVSKGGGDLEQLIRLNLAAWRPRLAPLRVSLPVRGSVGTVAYSPGGTTVMTAAEEAEDAGFEVKGWDARSGDLLWSLPPPGSFVRLTVVAPSFDDRSILGLCDLGLFRWDTSAALPLPIVLADRHYVLGTGWMSNPYLRATFSPDGTSILALGPGRDSVCFFERATGRLIGPFLPKLPGHLPVVMFCAFSPDGERVLTISLSQTRGEHHGLLQVWDAHTGASIGTTIRLHANSCTAAFRPDGRAVLSRGPAPEAEGLMALRSAQLWDVDTGKPIGPRLLHPSEIRVLGFGDDGQETVVGCDDGSIWIRDAATGTPVGPPVAFPYEVRSIALAPDGRSVLIGTPGGAARLHELPVADDGISLSAPRVPGEAAPAQAFAATFAPDGDWVLTAGRGVLWRWDADSGQLLDTILKGVPYSEPHSVALSPDSETVLHIGYTGMIILDLATGREHGPSAIELGNYWAQDRHAMPETQDPVLEDRQSVRSGAFLPDGRAILTTHLPDFGRMHGHGYGLWDVATGQLSARLPDTDAWSDSMAFSPDGRSLLTWSDIGACMRDPDTCRPAGPVFPLGGHLVAAAFAPDGNSVLAIQGTGSAGLWDPATGRLVREFFRNRSLIRAAAFAPDGTSVLTWDGEAVRLFDLPSGIPIGPPRPARLKSGHGALQYGPGGRVFLTLDPEGKPTLHRVPSPLPGEARRITAWLQVATGLELDADGAVHLLDSPSLDRWRERLRQLDGPPEH